MFAQDSFSSKLQDVRAVVTALPPLRGSESFHFLAKGLRALRTQEPLR